MKKPDKSIDSKKQAAKGAALIARLGETGRRIAEKHRTQEPGKLPKPPHRVMVSLTPQEFHDVHSLAFRAGTSVSKLGQLALVRLLLDAETGKLPLLPEFDANIPPGNA